MERIDHGRKTGARSAMQKSNYRHNILRARWEPPADHDAAKYAEKVSPPHRTLSLQLGNKHLLRVRSSEMPHHSGSNLTCAALVMATLEVSSARFFYRACQDNARGPRQL